MEKQLWHEADHWQDVLLQERARQKYAQALELAKTERIPNVGDIRLWFGTLGEMGDTTGYLRAGASSGAVIFVQRGLVVRITRGTKVGVGVYALFERRSEAKAFQSSGYPRMVHEWLLQTKPWALRHGRTDPKPAAPLPQADDGRALAETSVLDTETTCTAAETVSFTTEADAHDGGHASVLSIEWLSSPRATRFSLGGAHTKLPSGIAEQPMIVGTSSVLARPAALAERVARTSATVLITGETGVGKELVAQWIHLHSLRNQGTFAAVNCAAVPDGLFESLFFGHNRGSFTGADKTQFGLLNSADGGTLFLDEVGDLSLASQAKLLSTLETRSYRPVGYRQTFSSDFRIISATNKNLSEEVRRGTFREDMLHRITVFPIHVPPLRDRLEDVPLLLQFFVHTLSKKLLRTTPTVDPSVGPLLQEYHWPGNVRELRNVVERALIVCDDVLAREHIALGDYAFSGDGDYCLATDSESGDRCLAR